MKNQILGDSLGRHKNWLRWREFGEALRKVAEFRMPNLMDERLISTGEVFTIAAVKEARVVEEYFLDGSAEDVANARAAALFEPVYDSEAEVSKT